MPFCGQYPSGDVSPMTSVIAHIRDGVSALCKDFPGPYWQELDRTNCYPTEFVDALTRAGYLAALIPEPYGGSGLGLQEACAILEEISKSGGHPGACHAQMYVMGTLLRHGSDAQKQAYLPEISRGKLRLQAFAVTEPDAGSDTTRITTRADRDGNSYRINGRKIWISRVEHSDLMILLARTSKRDDNNRTAGLSVFLIDLRDAIGNGLTVTPIRTMMNHHTTELVFDDLKVPADSLIGKEGEGFRYILDGMNAERILIAAECIGDARFFISKATEYAKSRTVFERPIGQNQGVQFPIARAYVETEAAALMVDKAAKLFDRREPCGSEANMAKLLAADASWKAADMCIQIFGGAGFAADYDIERKFRETRLYQVAPLSTNLILSHLAVHDLGLPRSY
ncbi:Acyl-CoA dehydrogenase [hydrothermal vent metagenome]|uniref:Acyl-CoA dehydrogenase n=1 Tax=hydrothermal vent metagenome TaxID=652676 RepID=A0A3B0S8C4_9ZZZZ